MTVDKRWQETIRWLMADVIMRTMMMRIVEEEEEGQTVCLLRAGAAAWAIEQMAQHTEDSAGPLVEKGALLSLVEVMPQ